MLLFLNNNVFTHYENEQICINVKKKTQNNDFKTM
jgi:hypothetical protein